LKGAGRWSLRQSNNALNVALPPSVLPITIRLAFFAALSRITTAKSIGKSASFPCCNLLAMGLGLPPPRGKRHLSRCLVARSENGAKGRSLSLSNSFTTNSSLSAPLPWPRRGQSSPIAWQWRCPSPPSFFRDQQIQNRLLTCGDGKDLLSEVPDGCAIRPHLRSRSPEASTQRPVER
jgi:hypothetical protein